MYSILTKRKVLSKLFHFLSKYKYTILCLLFFYAITYASCGFNIHRLINVLSFFFVLHILSKTRYTLPISFILAFLVAIDAYFAFVFREQISMDIVASIYETGVGEIISMGKAIGLKALLFLIITFLLILKSEQELKDIHFSRKISLSILLIYCFIYIPGYLYNKLSTEEKGCDYISFSDSPMMKIEPYVKKRFPLIYGNLATTAAYLGEVYKLKHYSSKSKTLPSYVHYDKTKITSQRIYFVLGESSLRDHYSLFGYSYKTTPFLDSLKSNSSHLNYFKGISPAPITREALRIALSFANAKDKESFYSKKNIVELAKDAGYETSWVSNQDQIGVFDTYVGLISACAEKVYFHKKYPTEDFDLISKVKQQIDTTKKQCYFIHLNGSHQEYKDRYDETDKKEILKTQDKLITDYDRSIYHTNRVLQYLYEIISKDSSAIIYYLSDHGEIVGVGHGYAKGKSDQYKIPIITINNSKIPITPIIEKYINPKDKYLYSSNTIFIAAELLGYEIDRNTLPKIVTDNSFIYHVDSHTYLFEDYQQKYDHQ